MVGCGLWVMGGGKKAVQRVLGFGGLPQLPVSSLLTGGRRSCNRGVGKTAPGCPGWGRQVRAPGVLARGTVGQTAPGCPGWGRQVRAPGVQPEWRPGDPAVNACVRNGPDFSVELVPGSRISDFEFRLDGG